MKAKINELENENEKLKERILRLEEANEKTKQTIFNLEEENRRLYLKNLNDKNGPLSYDEMLKKYTDIDNIMEYDELSHLFVEFHESKFREEYPLFYRDVIIFKKITDNTTRYQKFVEMRNNYVEYNAP